MRGWLGVVLGIRALRRCRFRLGCPEIAPFGRSVGGRRPNLFLLGFGGGRRRSGAGRSGRRRSARRRSARDDGRRRGGPERAPPWIGPEMLTSGLYRRGRTAVPVVPVVLEPPRSVVVVVPRRRGPVASKCVVARIERVVVKTGVLMAILASLASAGLVGDQTLVVGVAKNGVAARREGNGEREQDREERDS